MLGANGLLHQGSAYHRDGNFCTFGQVKSPEQEEHMNTCEQASRVLFALGCLPGHQKGAAGL